MTEPGTRPRHPLPVHGNVIFSRSSDCPIGYRRLPKSDQDYVKSDVSKTHYC